MGRHGGEMKGVRRVERQATGRQGVGAYMDGSRPTGDHKLHCRP